MKKAMKKIIAALLAVAMLCAMAVPALAEDSATYKITAPNNDHTYQIYQIFTGDISAREDGTKVLSNIKWGKNGTGTEGETVDADTLTALTNVNSSSDADKLAVINTKVNFDSKAIAAIQNGQSTSVAPGYYLIKDQDGSLDDKKGESYTLYIVEVLDADLTITPKTDAPSVEKKVKENTKFSDTTYGAGYNDTADYNIGDSVPFKLIGRVPDMEHYSTYQYIFHDTLSSAFDAPSQADIKVALADRKDAEGTEINSSDYTVSVSGQNITVTFSNLKNVTGIVKDQYIIVTYSATLNANASVGQTAPGNTNKVYLEYSNNPNSSSSTGTTAEDQVIVFTYKLDVTKVDAQNQETKLKDAEFKLLNADKTREASVTAGKFSGWVEIGRGTTLKSDENGNFSVTGLDDGTYYLKETKAPTGYNLLKDPVKVTIRANTSNGQNGAGAVTELTSLTISVNEGEPANGTLSDGSVSMTVANNAGSTLPSTGGIGTTIFYVVGGGLMVAAIVLLVTKKRMENK